MAPPRRLPIGTELVAAERGAHVGFGERLTVLSDPATLRALTAVLLLAPALPLLFQGQECGTTAPWQFFVDHDGELRAAVRRGRARFMAQFARMATAEAQAALADPAADATFRACILDPRDRRLDHPHVALHRDLLRLRRDDPAFTDPRPAVLDGAVLSEHAFALRYQQDDPLADRLLLVNLGATLARAAVPEPLLAPPDATGWRVVWSSEDPRYGGHGTPPPFTRVGLAIPARAAIVLAPAPGAALCVELPPDEATLPELPGDRTDRRGRGRSSLVVPSTPSRRTAPAAARRRPGVWPSCCVVCCSPSAESTLRAKWPGSASPFGGCGRHDQCFQ